MIGPWPPREAGFKQEPQKTLTDAEKIKQLEQTIENLRTYIPRARQPRVVFESRLGRLFNLKPSKW